MRINPMVATVLGAAAVAGISDTALAHIGVNSSVSFMSGFTHPFGGLDHLVAMLAIGLLAARLGGRFLALVPVCFILALLSGAALASVMPHIPAVELLIAFSVAALGFLAASTLRLPEFLAALIAALFGFLHGHVHGTEIPLGASSAGYEAGMALASVLLIACGITMGSIRGLDLTRWAGGAIGAAGVLLLISI